MKPTPTRRRRNSLHRRRHHHPGAPRRLRGKRGVQRNALGRSRGGFSTKVHAIVDTKARPLHVTLTPGQAHEMNAAFELLDYARGGAFLGDTGCDSQALEKEARYRG